MTRTIFAEEPDAGKLACPVLKTNGSREGDVEFNKAATKSLGRALAGLGYGTQFSGELDEGSRVVDSPVERRPVQPSAKPPLQKVPTIAEQCKKLADDLGYTADQRDDLKQQHTVDGQVDWEAVKRQLMQEAQAKGKQGA